MSDTAPVYTEDDVQTALLVAQMWAEARDRLEHRRPKLVCTECARSMQLTADRKSFQHAKVRGHKSRDGGCHSTSAVLMVESDLSEFEGD